MSKCLVCGSPYVEGHHIIYGVANRRISNDLGYIAPLCREHHTGRDGVHFNREFDLYLKRKAQEHYEQTHTREEFIKTFGKSYI